MCPGCVPQLASTLSHISRNLGLTGIRLSHRWKTSARFVSLKGQGRSHQNQYTTSEIRFWNVNPVKMWYSSGCSGLTCSCTCLYWNWQVINILSDLTGFTICYFSTSLSYLPLTTYLPIDCQAYSWRIILSGESSPVHCTLPPRWLNVHRTGEEDCVCVAGCMCLCHHK